MIVCRVEDGVELCQGVKCGDVLITYKMIFQDIRGAIDWIHNEVSTLHDEGVYMQVRCVDKIRSMCTLS